MQVFEVVLVLNWLSVQKKKKSEYPNSHQLIKLPLKDIRALVPSDHIGYKIREKYLL